MLKQREKVKIMVFGTFDPLHKGHINFFRQARELARNPLLVVSVARDLNVKKIKGHRPMFSEKERLNMVKSHKLVDKAVLGGLRNHMPHILKEWPDIIALGYDQTAYIKDLKKTLKGSGLTTKVVRLKAYKPHLYKSSLVKRNLV